MQKFVCEFMCIHHKCIHAYTNTNLDIYKHIYAYT